MSSKKPTSSSIKKGIPDDDGRVTKKTKKFFPGEKDPKKAKVKWEETHKEIFGRPTTGSGGWSKERDIIDQDDYNEKPHYKKTNVHQWAKINGKGKIVEGGRTTTTYKDKDDKNGTESEEVYNPKTGEWEKVKPKEEEKKEDEEKKEEKKEEGKKDGKKE